MLKHLKRIHIIISIFLLILAIGIVYFYYFYSNSQSKQGNDFEYNGPVETISQGKIESITDNQITITNNLGDVRTTYNYGPITLLFKSVKDSNVMVEANTSDLKTGLFVGIILPKDYKENDMIKEIDIFTY